MEAGYAGACLQGGVQAVVAELLAAVAEPERRGVDKPVAAAGSEVPVQGASRVRTDGGGAVLAALAAADQHRAAGQIDVGQQRGHDLACPGAGLEHQPEDRVVPADPQVGSPAGGQRCLELVRGTFGRVAGRTSIQVVAQDLRA